MNWKKIILEILGGIFCILWGLWLLNNDDIHIRSKSKVQALMLMGAILIVIAIVEAINKYRKKQ